MAEELQASPPAPESALQALMRGLDHGEGGVPSEVEALATQLMEQAHAQGRSMTAVQAGWAAGQALAREPARDLPRVGARVGEADLACYRKMPTLAELPLTDAEHAELQEGRRSWWKDKHGILGRGLRGVISLTILVPMGLVGSDFIQGEVHGLGMGISGSIVLLAGAVGLWRIWRPHPSEVPESYVARRWAWYRARVARLDPEQRERLRQDERTARECRFILSELAHTD